MRRFPGPALRRSCSLDGGQPRRWSSSTAAQGRRPRTAIFFPGQGTQKVGMLTPWLEAFPSTASHLVDEMDHHVGYRLSDVIQNGPSRVLSQTTNAQPAIMATSIFILRILEREYNFRVADHFDVTLGHSLGEFAALDVPPIEQVLISNINSKNQIVLSGNMERIKTLIAHVRQFLGHDPRAVRLHSDSPFHSPIMKPAVAVMQALLNSKSRVPGRGDADMVTFPAALPCISNVSARPFASKEELKELLARGCLETVLWWDSIKYLDQEDKVRRWVGIGPGKVGRNLVGKEVGVRGRDLVKGGGVWAITDPGEVEEVLRGLEETAGLVDDEE
ncbi:protein related to [acyl-carrier-protein] S-malonyltransferase [Ophiocordyceps sinensis CO18]|uniref:[acyl-carrier-protein] S-malonyltransferase n=1 Tax=Ophiocordyceps sinensis (strain Co18 / CGMCC 3.14243) TaxID=911162 RepID=T5AE83_OPHSC|nr:protein related to [acyl-carrier-protein] S-malonyltransferase [Ophiocordyceps sinensis CO18]